MMKMVDSYESLYSEEWLLGNLLTADFYDVWDQLHNSGSDDVKKGDDLITDTPTAPYDQPAPNGLGSDHIEAFNIAWLDDDIGTNLAHISDTTNYQETIVTPLKVKPLDDVLIASTPKVPKLEPSPQPSSYTTLEPSTGRFLTSTPELPKLEPNYPALEPSSGGFQVPGYLVYQTDVSVSDSSFTSNSSSTGSIGTSIISNTQFSTIEINDLNILHLPEPSPQEAAMIILEALADPKTSDITQDLLSASEVESLLSSPPGSPVDSLVPSSPSDCVVPRSPPDLNYQSDASYDPDPNDEEYTPPSYSRKRKALGTSNYAPRGKMSKLNKKERKKLQNKNAATKYRIKKRDEAVTQQQEYEELETRNTALKKKVESLTQEIQYMKSIMNDVMHGKGVSFT